MNINKIEIGDTGQSALDKINTNESNLLTEISTLAQDMVRKSSLSQHTGSSTDEAMSQDAVTKKLSQKADQTYVDDKLQGLVYKDPVATKSLLLSGELGWVRLVLDENVLYQCQGGSTWVKTGLTAFPKDVLVKSDVKQLVSQNSTLPVSEDAVQKKFKGFSDELESKNFFKPIREKGFAICDARGYAALTINEDAKTNLNMTEDAIERLKNKINGEGEWLESFFAANVNHVIGYGQSLGEGLNAFGVITSYEFSPFAKMFNHGIVTRHAKTPKYESFVPHVEKSVENDGETPCAGLVDSLIQYVGEGVFTNKTILSSCCAKDGESVATLSKGSTWYNNILADVTNAKRIAAAQNKTYRLVAITWTQGEYDYNTSIIDYKQRLKQLRSNLITDIEAITGDNYSNLPFIMYQVSSGSQAGAITTNYPAIAQLQLGTEDATNGFYLATPVYHLRYNDMWHLDAYSYKFMGSYYGYALSKIAKGQRWLPLYPISHTINGSVILLKFSKSGLMFEYPPYLNTNGIKNRGFSIKNALNVEIISAVEIVGGDTIKLTCSESPIGRSIKYAFEGANGRNAGELHDGNTDVYVADGFERNLYNWCAIFDYKL